MAIIQANMQRIDEDNLFEGIEIKPQKQNIATPGQLLIACEINNFPVDLNKILSHLNLSLEEINLDNEISGILNVKKRIIYLDYLRVIAIVAVLLNHISANWENAIVPNSTIALIYNAFGRIGVPLFLMLTGVLLLNNKLSIKELN